MEKITKREILKYILFGMLTTVVSWGSYTLFVNIFKTKMSDFWAVFWSNALSWVLAATFAFVTNKIWVFRSKEMSPKGLAKEILTFLSSRIVTGVMEIVLVPLLEKISFDKPFYSIVSAIGLSQKLFLTKGIYSKIFVSVFVVVLNYFFSKFVVFKNKNKGE